MIGITIGPGQFRFGGRLIEGVKAIRAATGLGLKEAKQLADALDAGREVQTHVNEEKDIIALRRFGLVVNSALSDADDLFQKLMAILLKNRDADLCEKLSGVYRDYLVKYGNQIGG